MKRKYSANLEDLLVSSPIKAAFLTDALTANPVLHIHQMSGQRISLSVVTNSEGILSFYAVQGEGQQDPYQPEEKF
jgi:hypothetical protein